MGSAAGLCIASKPANLRVVALGSQLAVLQTGWDRRTCLSDSFTKTAGKVSAAMEQREASEDFASLVGPCRASIRKGKVLNNKRWMCMSTAGFSSPLCFRHALRVDWWMRKDRQRKAIYSVVDESM